MHVLITRVALAVLVLSTGGCALFDRDRDEAAVADGAGVSEAADVVARDLVGALVQLDGHAPGRMAVRFDAAEVARSDMLAALERAMRGAGYAIRSGNGVPDRVAHVSEPTEFGAVVHTVSVGEVQLRRRYAPLADGRWMPDGSLFVRGADASGISLGASAEPQAPSAKPPVPAPRPSAEPPTNGTVITPAPDLSAPAPAAPIRPSPAPAPTRAIGSPRAAPLEIDGATGKPVYSGLVTGARRPPVTENVFELGGSNFSSVFASTADVEEVILIFPNDSLQLGAANKETIQRTLELYEPASDRFAIVGCSLGPTRIENGNAALALGRANRVKEELLFAGVPPDRILDEGCWAGQADTHFPSRGVVLTLKRES